jgi:hypothetical protein
VREVEVEEEEESERERGLERYKLRGNPDFL